MVQQLFQFSYDICIMLRVITSVFALFLAVFYLRFQKRYIDDTAIGVQNCEILNMSRNYGVSVACTTFQANQATLLGYF